MAVSVVSEDMPFPLTRVHTVIALNIGIVQAVFATGAGLVDGQVANAAAKAPKYVASAPAERTCRDCKLKHTHLYQCEKFHAAVVADRYIHCVRALICFSCLRLDSDVKHKDMAQWQEDHQVDYNLDWICTEDNCAAQQEIGQYHVMLCAKHATGNKKHKAQLVTECDLPAGKLLFSSVQLNMQMGERLEVLTGGNVHQDVYTPSVFMLHNLTICGQQVLIFYDSGCQTACISKHGHDVLSAVEVCRSPTTITVTSNTNVKIPGGEVQFHIPLSGDTVTDQWKQSQCSRWPMYLPQCLALICRKQLAAGKDTELWLHFDSYWGGHVDS